MFLKIVPKIHRRTPVPESLFLIKLKVQACNFIRKEALAQVILRNLLRTLMSENISRRLFWKVSKRHFEKGDVRLKRYSRDN